MTERTGPQAGGALLALTTVVGAIAGTVLGQATIGVIVGVAVGIVLAVAIWLRDRNR